VVTLCLPCLASTKLSRQAASPRPALTPPDHELYRGGSCPESCPVSNNNPEQPPSPPPASAALHQSTQGLPRASGHDSGKGQGMQPRRMPPREEGAPAGRGRREGGRKACQGGRTWKRSMHGCFSQAFVGILPSVLTIPAPPCPCNPRISRGSPELLKPSPRA